MDERSRPRVEVSQYPSATELAEGLPLRWQLAITGAIIAVASTALIIVASPVAEDFRNGWMGLGERPGTTTTNNSNGTSGNITSYPGK
jgi:hypothetical protein